MKTTAEKVAVMQAAIDGKTIEFCPRDYTLMLTTKWKTLVLTKEDEIIWNWEENDYRVSVPPVKKVKLWQWVYQPSGGKNCAMSHGFYRDETEAIASLGIICAVLFKAPWTEIEIKEGV